ncbi:cholinesterase-like [Polymixia lowei]
MATVIHHTPTRFLLPLLLLHLLSASLATQEDLIIKTKSGKVRGTPLSVAGSDVKAFLGIPYGKSPVGKLRFRAPEPAESWEGVKDATKFPNSCYQLKDTTFPGFIGAEMWNPNTPLSEDCLYLNVWSPPLNQTQPPQVLPLAPVLVWIYGGGFSTGTSSLDVYDGRFLSQSEGVVVVSMNYRQGSLGFLSLPDNKNIHGNAGLLDQQLALRWVANNIAAFGGDPSKVTLFGESAGAASVGFHLLSPGSHGLFHKAILQSGSPNAPWATISQTEAWDSPMSSTSAGGVGVPYPGNVETINDPDPGDVETINDDTSSASSGLLVADEINDILEEFQIKTKVVASTVDNASSMDGAFCPYPQPGSTEGLRHQYHNKVVCQTLSCRGTVEEVHHGENVLQGKQQLLNADDDFRKAEEFVNITRLLYTSTLCVYQAVNLGKLLGCPVSPPDHLEACLQRADPADIAVKQYEIVLEPAMIALAFAPVVDRNFLPDEPEVLLQNGNFLKTEVILGLNKDEGTYFLVYGMPGYDITSQSLISRSEFLQGMSLAVPGASNVTRQASIHQYTDWTDENNTTKNRDALGILGGDQHFICPMLEFARRYSQHGGKAVLYLFDHRSSTNPWPEWMGTMHGYEIEFVFGMPLNQSLGYTQTEVTMSRRFMKHWANFARTGNPSIGGADWPIFTTERQDYVTLNSQPPQQKSMLRAQQCHFWSNLKPEIQQVSGCVKQKCYSTLQRKIKDMSSLVPVTCDKETDREERKSPRLSPWSPGSRCCVGQRCGPEAERSAVSPGYAVGALAREELGARQRTANGTPSLARHTGHQEDM